MRLVAVVIGSLIPLLLFPVEAMFTAPLSQRRSVPNGMKMARKEAETKISSTTTTPISTTTSSAYSTRSKTTSA